MNKVRNYYWYVGVPIVSIILGGVFFFDAIMGTMEGNPHPELNYIIAALTALGCAIMLGHVIRMSRDAKLIDTFFDLARAGKDASELRTLLASGKRDPAPVLEMVADIQGRSASSVQHAALEAEQHRYQAKQSRYQILPQFMSGMMVGLGLLGTFVGLLGALAEIGKLVGAFSLTMGGDPTDAIRILVERLVAPMQSMGVAFSSSLFGVVGSLIMGVLSVGVRNCSGELVGLLETRITYHIDFVGEEPASEEIATISAALSELADQSPVLRGLAIALDHSERRVRELVNTMVQLSARVDMGERQTGKLVELLVAAEARDERSAKALEDTSRSMEQLALRWVIAERTEEKIHGLLVAQQSRQDQMAATLLGAQEAQLQMNAHLSETLALVQTSQGAVVERLTGLATAFKETSTHLEVGLRDLAGVQRRGSDQLIEVLNTELREQSMLQQQEAAKAAETTLTGLRDLAGVQRRSSDQVIELLNTELRGMTVLQQQEAAKLAEAMLTGLKDLAGAHRRAAEESTRETLGVVSGLAEVVDSQKADQRHLAQQVGRLSEVITQLAGQNVTGMKSVVDSYQSRQEQLADQQSATIGRLSTALESSISSQRQIMLNLDRSISSVATSVQGEAMSGAQLVNRLELMLQESTERQLHILESLLRAFDEFQPATVAA